MIVSSDSQNCRLQANCYARLIDVAYNYIIGTLLQTGSVWNCNKLIVQQLNEVLFDENWLNHILD